MVNSTCYLCVGIKAKEGKIFTKEKTLLYYDCNYSPIHDHSNSHCFMRILQGSVKETQYYWPDDEKEAPVKEKCSTVHKNGEVAYINGMYLLAMDPYNKILVFRLHWTAPSREPQSYRRSCVSSSVFTTISDVSNI